MLVVPRWPAAWGDGALGGVGVVQGHRQEVALGVDALRAGGGEEGGGSLPSSFIRQPSARIGDGFGGI